MLPTDAPSRPDALLAVVGVALVAATLATVAFGMPFRVTGAAGSVIGAVAIADGVFRNPPTDG
ncbi:hypothetical protein [Halobaculum gomorrense]|uniref:Uncharacterized protein n=1 Tax=Halobaculum gomorrense TaxID=43928 RepID=A0A1M5MF79_9EURY|nr:hypothetical protein [Halobaculum gomorrense]SHG75822.1 hypothetical protein SAMN05443636_0991 [Halobaculum gomorrense]